MKRKHRILPFFLTVSALFLLFIFTVSVGATSTVISRYGDLSWQLVEDTGALYIYGNHKMAQPADGESYPWLRYAGKITSVIINEDVLSISADAFAGCENLASVTIGQSVQNIGRDAFSGCINLSSVTIHSPYVAEYLTDISACGDLIAHADKVYVLEGMSLSPDFFKEHYACISVADTTNFRYTLYSKGHTLVTSVVGTDGSRFETKCLNGCGYVGEASTIIQGGIIQNDAVIIQPQVGVESNARSRTPFFIIIAVMTVGSVLASVILNRRLNARRKHQ